MRLSPLKRAFHHRRYYPNAFALHGNSAQSTFLWSTATSTGIVSSANLSSQPRIKNHTSDIPAEKLVFYADRKPEPWKSLLGLTARAAWRVAPAKPSPALEAAQKFILEEKGHKRSHKVLRRTLEDMMQSHRSLADRRDRERRRLISANDHEGNQKKDRKPGAKVQPILYGPNEAMAAIKFRLFPNYTIVKRVLQEVQSLLGPDSFQPKKVIDFGIGCGSASAAAADIWPDSIQWIHGIDPSLTMREGAEAFLKEYHRIIKEQGGGDNDDEEMSAIATTAPSPRLTFSAHLSAEASTANSFDLALFVYTATELPQNSSTLAAAALLWEKLSPGGLFVMIEPGTPDGFSSVRTVRNMLLDCSITPVHDADEADDDDGEEREESEEPSPRHQEECYIIAPCTHSGACPMDRFKRYSPRQTQIDVTNAHARKGDEKADSDDFANIDDQEEDDDDDEDDDDTEREDEDGDEAAVNDDDDGDARSSNDDDDMTRRGYCSFVQSMPGKSGLGKGEKFSYIVAQKRSIDQSFQSASPSFEDVDVTKLLKHALAQKPTLDNAIALEQRYLESDEDDLGLELIRGDKQRFGRIIHAPKKKKSHVHIDSCEAPGRIVRYSISKRKASVAPGLYAAARASRWGGYWPSTTTRYEN